MRSCASPNYPYESPLKLSFPSCTWGTHLSAKLRFVEQHPMRSRYRVNDSRLSHFVTGTIVSWLPVFTTAARCDILLHSFEYCRTHKGLKIHAWVILDNHFHAILAARNLSRVLADLKWHTAQRILGNGASGCSINFDIFACSISLKALIKFGRKARIPSQ